MSAHRDGVSGNALAQAQALCVKPFEGVDLKTVSQTDQKNLNNFRVSAQDAEDQKFNGQVRFRFLRACDGRTMSG